MTKKEGRNRQTFEFPELISNPKRYYRSLPGRQALQIGQQAAAFQAAKR
jgi:hypothetical protein